VINLEHRQFGADSGHSLDRVGAALFDRKQPLKSDIVQAE
jgi:hypothetical protein